MPQNGNAECASLQGGGSNQDSMGRTAIYSEKPHVWGNRIVGGVFKNFLDEGWEWVSPWPFYYKKPCWHRVELKMSDLDSTFT